MGQGAKAAPKAAPNPVAQKPKLQRGQVVRGNFRPVNTMAKPPRSNAPVLQGSKKQNIAAATAMLQSEGVAKVTHWAKRGSAAAAWAYQGQVAINTSHNYWKDPHRYARHNRRTGHLSTSDPRGAIFHEAAHLKFPQSDNFGFNQRALAGRVSRYARMNPKEFLSETYAGRRTGRKYDHQVMRLYLREKQVRVPNIRSQTRRRRSAT
jgi:hypothetical protein